MSCEPLRVLVQLREALVERVAERAPGVALATVPWEGELPPNTRGEVLLTLPWASPNLPQLLASGVRWIHLLGTGIDRFPLDRLGADQILTCSRGASAIPIAEWVLAVMLAFEKRLPDTWIHAAPARWSRADLGGLYGRTLGLVGIGGIGRAVAERARPFGMRVLVHRRTAAAAGVDGVERVESLVDLVAASDHIVIAAPATPATHHLFSAEIFAAIKPGAHLINVSRGALVDQDALRAALDDGRVAMASLDAVDPEPLPDGHWLYGHPRVRLSPHISWHMPGAVELLIEPFIDNLERYRAGADLTGVVDRGERY